MDEESREEEVHRGESVIIPMALEPEQQDIEAQQTDLESELLYCIHCEAPWRHAIFLGFQNYVVNAGTTVALIAPYFALIGGTDRDRTMLIHTTMFANGLNTLVQCNIGTRLPATIGVSLTYNLSTLSIIYAHSHIEDPQQRFNLTIRAIQGSHLVAAVFQVAVGFTGLWSIAARFLTPLSAIPLVTTVALSLYQYAFPLAINCAETGTPSFVLVLLISTFIPKYFSRARIKIILELYNVAISIVILWTYSYILTVSGVYDNKKESIQTACRTDRAGFLNSSSWLRVPYPFQWGIPTVEVGEAFSIIVASFVVIVESTGTYLSIARFSGATPVPPHVIGRGIGFQGVGSFLNASFGTFLGYAPSNACAGLLAMTRVGSRRVTQITAGMMICFSIIGKVGGFFYSIPVPIVGAVCCISYGYESSAGLTFADILRLNHSRKTLLFGVPLFIGFSIRNYFTNYNQIYQHYPISTSSIALNNSLNTIFLSIPTMAFLLAVLMDAREGRARWWQRFRCSNRDADVEEIYPIPQNLNQYLPHFRH